jgi:hypothetical protein
VESTGNTAIYAQNLVDGTNLSVTTGAGTRVTGSYLGIFAQNFGSGTLTVTANGDVTGTNGRGIVADNGAGGPIAITVSAASHVTSTGTGPNAFAIDIFRGPGNVTLAGTLNGGAGGALRFDQLTALDDRLELQPGAVVNGNVFGGPAPILWRWRAKAPETSMPGSS